MDSIARLTNQLGIALQKERTYQETLTNEVIKAIMEDETWKKELVLAFKKGLLETFKTENYIESLVMTKIQKIHDLELVQDNNIESEILIDIYHRHCPDISSELKDAFLNNYNTPVSVLVALLGNNPHKIIENKIFQLKILCDYHVLGEIKNYNYKIFLSYQDCPRLFLDYAYRYKMNHDVKIRQLLQKKYPYLLEQNLK